jgi:hypothetical protein
MKPAHDAELVAALFAAGAFFAIIHLALGAPYEHSVHLYNVALDAGLAATWLCAAAGALVRRTFASLLAVIVGTATAFLHGLLFSVAAPGTGDGVPFLVASAVIPLLLVRSAPAWRVLSRPAAPEPSRRASTSRPSHA